MFLFPFGVFSNYFLFLSLFCLLCVMCMLLNFCLVDVDVTNNFFFADIL
jgi:hypothetical protein